MEKIIWLQKKHKGSTSLVNHWSASLLSLLFLLLLLLLFYCHWHKLKEASRILLSSAPGNTDYQTGNCFCWSSGLSSWDQVLLKKNFRQHAIIQTNSWSSERLALLCLRRYPAGNSVVRAPARWDQGVVGSIPVLENLMISSDVCSINLPREAYQS